jgi:hypothetical protein
MHGHGPHGMYRRHTSLLQDGLSIVRGSDFFESEASRERKRKARKRLDRIGPWAYPMLKSSSHWPRLVRLLEALLSGMTARAAAIKTGRNRKTACRIQGMLSAMRGNKCACGRPSNHQGACTSRRLRYPDKWKKKSVCKRGHELGGDNLRNGKKGSSCRACHNELKVASRVKMRMTTTRNIAKMLQDNRVVGVVLKFRTPVRIALAAIMLRDGRSYLSIVKELSVSVTTLTKLCAALRLAGWRCGCGKDLAHKEYCTYKSIRGRSNDRCVRV